MLDELVYQSVKTKSGIVGYCKAGYGKNLILLVGYSGTLFHWNRIFIAELTKFFCVYLIDNRKIGASESDNPISMLGLATDVADFIDVMQLQDSLVLGWSMGGMIAQTLVQYFPHLVSGLILLSSVPHPSYTSERFIDLLINQAMMPPIEFEQQLYSIFFSDTTGIQFKDIIKSSAVMITNYPYRFSVAAKELQDESIMYWSGMSEQDLLHLTMPVLILRARNDLIVSFAASEFLAKHCANAKLIEYTTGGHFVLHAIPQELARDICSFLH